MTSKNIPPLFPFALRMTDWILLLLLSTTSILVGSAFQFSLLVPQQQRHRTTAAYSASEIQKQQVYLSSSAMGLSTYEVDSDEDAEQNLGTGTLTNAAKQEKDCSSSKQGINGGEVDGNTTNSSSSNNRYDSLLESVGLQGKLKLVDSLPSHRTISSNDVFCNRELKMGRIRAIGFDMDYTLAQYQQPAFDQLAFDGAKRKLVQSRGYPEEVLDFEYDHTSWIRGLIIDTQRGNFLKIDRHKYVRVAYHGFEKISSTTRKILYSRTFNKVPSFSEKSFVNMDTLFQFVDAHLFALLVDLKDKSENEFLDFKTYEEIYREIRECVDLCHRDGVIKDVVAQEPHKYLVHDKKLIPMLQKLRKESGMKLFLLTNSYWEYTSTAMNYLYHGKLVDDETQKKNEWLELFDLAIAGSCKPAYMLDPYLNLFRVNPQNGSLLNTDGVYEIEALGEDGAEKFLAKGKTFQGGNWLHLHAMLNIEAGEEILYVGDHLYADVLRSKRTLGWRSAFIVPELEEEIRVFDEKKHLFKQITELRLLRDELSHMGEEIVRRRDENTNGNDCNDEIKSQLNELLKEDFIIKERLTSMAAEWHATFHPIWGAMFNAGYQDSRFAFYVQNYACLYTSKATNLGLTSSMRDFRTGLEMLPHDRLVAGDDAKFEKHRI